MKYVTKLIRFTAAYFWSAAAIGTVMFCIVPLLLGVAARAFFTSMSATALAAVVGAMALEVAGDLALSKMWSGFSYKTHTLLNRNLFAGMLRGYGEHGLRVPVGDALTRFRSDPPAITYGAMDGVCDLIGRGLFAIVAAVVMWRVDPTMTIAAFAPVVAAALVSDALGSRASRYGAAALDADTSLGRFLGEVVNGQLAVRVAGAEERVVGRIDEIGESRRRFSLRDRVFAEIVNSMNTHLVHVSTGVVLLLGASSIRSGRFTVGDFAMFVVFLDQLTYLPAEIGRVITESKRTTVSIERMHMLVPGEDPETLVAAAPIHLRGPLPDVDAAPARERLERLEVRGLTYLHPASGRGVDDVTFTVERGSLTVITGPIGSGKTTLLHTILGLLPRQAGDVTWNGVVVDDPAAFFVPPRSAFTPQEPCLFSAALRDNLVLGRDRSEDHIRAAVEAAVLEDDVAVLEAGLDTLVGTRGVKLSGGQAQRAAAARMFLGDAELLVFDDLSSALDVATEAELWRRLFARTSDVTCLVVSHSPIVLARADQVLRL